MRSVIPALAAAALVVVGLTACTGSSDAGTADAKGCPAAPSGSASEKVKVTGKIGDEPKVSFTKGLKVDATERTVVTAGKGAAVKDGDTVLWDYALYNGTSGKKIGAFGYSAAQPSQAFPISDNTLKGLAKTLDCTVTGSRVVAVIPPEDAFGSSGQEQLGLGAADDLVVVADVKSVLPVKADGAKQKAPEGFPAVTLAKSGKPTVAVSTAAAPTETKVADLKKGDGETVKEGDTVYVQYQGSIYGTGKVFDQSWGKGIQAFPTTGVVKGFAQALVGQKVGSQVIALIPPADGYGSAGQPSAGISGTDTLVFVIDIVGVSHKA